MKEMRASIPDDGYLGRSTQSETYTSLYDIEIARRLSEQRGIGLADFLMRQLADRFDENAGGETAP
jgi:Rod binding domain-containing protein